MLSKGVESFYSQDSAGKGLFYDVKAGGYVSVPRSHKDVDLAYLKATKATTRLKMNSSASAWDLGEGVLGLEFHSSLNAKMNPIDDDIITMMHDAVDLLEADFDAMVIYHDGENFSAGANLLLLYMAAQQELWGDIRSMVQRFQQANQRLRYSTKPVVVAPAGLALGGGAEVVLGGNAVQAAAELYIGLVEMGMGLIPGGAGNLNLLKSLMGRFTDDAEVDPFPYLKKTFMAIGMAKVCTSAEEGREAGFLSQSDGVTLNRSFLLHDAKQRALGMARSGFRAPTQRKFRLPGRDGAATIDMLLYSMVQNNQISAHDRKVGQKLAAVLTGGEKGALNALVTEDYLLELEQEAFLSLCGEAKTQERIGHFLQTGKPLRN
jgi:3-hydroxyacyl-CoA dehydrogenase